MGRFARSWHMFPSSWRILRSRKELAVFPVLSGLASVVVAAGAFLVPAAPTIQTDGSPTAASSVLAFGFSVVAAYVTVFFHTALISQADVALSGGDPSVAGGLRVAGANWARILRGR